MGERQVGCFIVFIFLPFALLASLHFTSAQQLPLCNLIHSHSTTTKIKEDKAELLWTDCRLELINAREAIEGNALYSREPEFRYRYEIILKSKLSLKLEIEKVLTSKKTLLDCVENMDLMFSELGGDSSSMKWYAKYIGSFFSRSNAHRRLLQDSAPAPAPMPAPAPAPAVASPASSPTSPSPKVDYSQHPASPPSYHFFPSQFNQSSPNSAAGELSPRSSPNEPKQNKNRKTVVVAVALTASVTFFAVACLFLCYYKVCGTLPGTAQNDERPLLHISLSNYSVDPFEKSFASGNSINVGMPSNPSFRTNSNDHTEGDIGTFNIGTPLGIVTGVTRNTDDDSIKKPVSPLKPHPSGLTTEELSPLEHPSGSAKPSELSPPVKGVPPPPPLKGVPPPPPLPVQGVPPPHVLPSSLKPFSGSSLPPHPGPSPPPIPSAIKTGAHPPRPPGSGIPPPRLPTMGLKPPRPSPYGPNNPSTSTPISGEWDEANAPKAKLKPFFWDKVLANPDHSMVWHQIKSGSFQFDEEMIESLFGAAAGRSKKEAKKDSPSQDHSSHYIQILEPKKSQNLSILLKALNVTTEEVCDALQEGNELPSELVEALLKMAPTAEEELKLRLYSGELYRLGTAERFLKVLVDIPFAFKRLESLLFMCTLQEEASIVKESFLTLEAACAELKKSRLFLKLLEAVLKTGNRMNDGTFRGGAQAFKLDTLLKLSDVKGADGRTTLLHFVVQEIIRSEGVRAARAAIESQNMHSVKPDDLEGSSHDMDDHYRDLGLQVVSGLGDELENVAKAAGLDADSLTGTVAKLGHGLVKVKDFLNTDMKRIDENNRYHHVLKSFVQNAEVDVMWLVEEERRIMALVKSTADYFHGNAGKDEGLRLFVIVRDFLLILNKSCKEVKDAQKKTNKRPRKEELTATPPSSSASSNAPFPNPQQRLFPAIKDRRMDSSSSDEDSL